MTQGQHDYEADVVKHPFYHDGTKRKTWEQLSKPARWSWDHPYFEEHKYEQ